MLRERDLQIFYGSLHDIESYPCEDGDAELVRDASTCIEGAHGQWIWNGKSSVRARVVRRRARMVHGRFYNEVRCA